MFLLNGAESRHERRMERREERRERKEERHLEHLERREERHREHLERKEQRHIEHHLRDLQRLGYVSQAPVSPYPSPPFQYDGMPGRGYNYAYGAPSTPPIGLHPGQGYPSMYPGQYPGQYPPNTLYAGQSSPSINASPGQASPNMYASPSQGLNTIQLGAGQIPQMEYIPHNSNMGYTAHNGVKVEKHEADRHWYDLDDSKKGALIAGGLILGLAAIAGGAYYVHNKHKKEGEEMKAQAWEVQNWMITANQRSEAFLRDGPKAPTTWIYNSHIDEVKDDLIPGGEEDGQPWYIARACHNGDLLVGKCRPGVGAFLGSDDEAIEVNYYEVLVGDPKTVKWVRHEGKFSPADLNGAHPIEGGRGADKTPFAIVRAQATECSGILGFSKGGKGGVFPGMTSTKVDGAYVTVGDKNVKVDEYEVLCYV